MDYFDCLVIVRPSSHGRCVNQYLMNSYFRNGVWFGARVSSSCLRSEEPPRLGYLGAMTCSWCEVVHIQYPQMLGIHFTLW